MGLSIASEKFRPEDYRQFSTRLTECLYVLSEMLQDPGFGGNISSWGAELELYLVDNNGKPVHCNQAVLSSAANPKLTPELNRFNLEYNSSPVANSTTPLSVLQCELDDALASLTVTAAPFQASPLAIGILPTLTPSDFGTAHMTDLPRYRALSNALKHIGSGNFRIDINGEPPLQFTANDVTYEGANTSFQVHYRVSPSRFAKLYNGLILATPIVLGLAANSPTLFGHKLWHETRVPLFKHSIDSRQRSRDWRQPARVSLGHGYLRHSVYELFAEAAAIQPVLLPVYGTENYREQWRKGIAPNLNELRMHQNTVWSWLRPVYDNSDGGHFRIELRSLPAGPTVTDMLANAAFYIGLGEALAEQTEQLLPAIPFHYAKYNFYRAAQFGPEARLVWPVESRHQLEERQLLTLAKQLLPLAKEGLQRIGFSPEEIHRYLSVIEERIGTGVTPAQWQLTQLERMQCQWPASPTQLKELLAGYQQRQLSGQPVAKWSHL